MVQIAILGTGMIGTSIGLALKDNPDVTIEKIVGYDRDKSNMRAAKKVGAVDDTEGNLHKALKDASIIILAAPVLSNHLLLEEISESIAPGTVVTDTGSTKNETLMHALDCLPKGVDFIGSHPMAGTTGVGPAHADKNLFKDQTWIITAPANAKAQSVNAIFHLAESLGSKPMIMDAEEHDAYVAAISHAPMVISQALFKLMRSSEAWPELSVLAAGGFKSVTRLSGTDPSMAFDILKTNRAQIIHWIDRYITELDTLRHNLEDFGDEDLFRLIAQIELDYGVFMDGAIGRREESNMEGTGSDLGAMLIGHAMKDKVDEMTRRADERVQEKDLARRMRRDI
tara:strand:+ start:545 stop:1567 length:1023 start_codon:yes stop_codon:yes gene_type:complete